MLDLLFLSIQFLLQFVYLLVLVYDLVILFVLGFENSEAFLNIFVFVDRVQAAPNVFEHSLLVRLGFDKFCLFRLFVDILGIFDVVKSLVGNSFGFLSFKVHVILADVFRCVCMGWVVMLEHVFL